MEKITRTLVCGDIHGSLKGLQQALERCKYNSKEDKLIFLGDYVDGWSESAELIEYLIQLDKVSINDNIFIRGNHDKWCQEWLNKGQIKLVWTQQGGQATIDSYMKTCYLTSDSHRKFFNNLHNYYIDDENRGFSHGGFISRKGLGHEPYEANYYWDRDLWNLALMSHNKEKKYGEEGPENYSRFKKHTEIYIGHTSTIYWNHKVHYTETEEPNQVGLPIMVPMNRCNVWNLDTGAGYKGKLTIMDIDTKEFWQSDQSHLLYPYEKGR